MYAFQLSRSSLFRVAFIVLKNSGVATLSDSRPGWPAREKYSFQWNDGLSFSSSATRHLVIEQFGIATLHSGHRSIGQGGLDSQDGLSLSGGDLGASPSSSNIFCTWAT